jgi:carbonic anhydrase/acetyltransferase-like protein (isoleucine patch superfamily)
VLEIILTREDANTESAIVTEWLVADGQDVQRHQAVVVVETTKASLEIEAPGSGTLVHLYDEGAEVEPGELIALVAETAAELETARARRSAVPAPDTAAPARRKATRKAVELAARHGIDLDAIDKQGFVTTEDVEALIAATGGAAEEGAASVRDDPLAGIATEGVTFPASFSVDETAGTLDPAFLEELRADETVFRALPAAEKLARYRAGGASIGEEVILGEGTVVVAPRIVLADGVRIGHGGTVRCADVVAIGTDSAFGPNLELTCRSAYLGAGIWGGRAVRFGGGGHREPWAVLVVGDLAFVGDETFVNVCRPVLIGRETFVTMRSMIVTHNIGHSVLEGYENRFAPVVLEDRAQLGLGAVVYAGCRIGRGAIVASCSYVVSDIPPDALAIGVPARASGSAARTVSAGRREELARGILEDLAELLALRGHAVGSLHGDTTPAFDLDTEHGRSSVTLVPRLRDVSTVARAEAETVILTLAYDGGGLPAGVSVFDLIGREVHGAGGGPLHESVRELCRKRGIRFTPEPWRYLGGLI